MNKQLFRGILQNNSWQLDALSLVIGVLGGLTVAYLFYLAWPFILRWLHQTREAIEEARIRRRFTAIAHFREETANYVQKRHLGNHLGLLSELVVPPLLARPPEKYLEVNQLKDSSMTAIHYLWPDLAAGIAAPPPPTMPIRQLLIQSKRTIITGQSGTGKTTLLAYAAYLCATATEAGPYALFRDFMPIFIHMAELKLQEVTAVSIIPENDDDETEPIEPHIETALDKIVMVLAQRGKSLDKTNAHILLEKKLESNELILFLDGWDELAQSQKPLAVKWLTELLKTYPQMRIITTSLTHNFGELLNLKFTVTHILPWRFNQVTALDTKWAQLRETEDDIVLQGEDFWQPGQTALEIMLRLQLHQSGDVINAMTPRWTDLMEASLRAHLRETKTEIAMLLDEEQDEEAPTDEEVKLWLSSATLDLWQQIAFHLLSEEKLALSAEEVNEITDHILTEFEVNDRRSRLLLEATLHDNGLFVKWYDQSISFINPVWRDFLASAWMRQDTYHNTPKAHLFDDKWADAIRFYVGRTGADQFANEVLAQKDDSLVRLEEPLFLVASWLSEALDKGKWRRQVLVHLGQLVTRPQTPQILRQRAAAMLAQLNDKGVPGLLRKLLTHQDPVLRQAAIAGLARLGAEVALEPIQKMLEDKDQNVRQAAVQALAWLKSPEADSPLITSLIDPSEAVSRSAALGLLLNKKDGVAILKEALVEDDIRVRRAAIYGLAALDEYWVVEKLESVLQNDEESMVRLAANSALDEMAERNRNIPWGPPRASTQEWLTDWLKDTNQHISSSGPTTNQLMEAIIKAEKPQYRTAAAILLGRMGLKSAITPLKVALRDSNPEVRNAAFTALARIAVFHQN